jgi:hypothetical protein
VGKKIKNIPKKNLSPKDFFGKRRKISPGEFFFHLCVGDTHAFFQFIPGTKKRETKNHLEDEKMDLLVIIWTSLANIITLINHKSARKSPATIYCRAKKTSPQF